MALLDASILAASLGGVGQGGGEVWGCAETPAAVLVGQSSSCGLWPFLGLEKET